MNEAVGILEISGEVNRNFNRWQSEFQPLSHLVFETRPFWNHSADLCNSERRESTRIRVKFSRVIVSGTCGKVFGGSGPRWDVEGLDGGSSVGWFIWFDSDSFIFSGSFSGSSDSLLSSEEEVMVLRDDERACPGEGEWDLLVVGVSAEIGVPWRCFLDSWLG
jgi:hypothetical protein